MIADGAAVDVSAVDGQVNIRADVVNSERVRSMRLELTGPVSASRLENGPAPYALFGDSGRGDYYAERLAAGAYRLQATPYGGRDGGGAVRRAHEVSFTIPYVPPTATIAADAARVSEGAVASFTVTLDRMAERTLRVAVTVVESGNALSGVPPRAVTFEPDRMRATLAVATDDDAVVEAPGTVTATLTTGPAYEVGTRATATTEVADNDAAVFAVAAAPDLIEEGGTATVTLAITNGTTFAEERTVSLSVSGLAAGSYTLEPATAVLAAGATSLAAAFTALEDGEEDVPRTARVEAVVDTSVVGTELTVEDVGPAPRIAGVPQVGGVSRSWSTERDRRRTSGCATGRRSSARRHGSTCRLRRMRQRRCLFACRRVAASGRVPRRCRCGRRREPAAGGGRGGVAGDDADAGVAHVRGGRGGVFAAAGAGVRLGGGRRVSRRATGNSPCSW